jgi:Na+-transporting NADH:ubiquinone oxidoreductase subunit NqrC
MGKQKKGRETTRSPHKEEIMKEIWAYVKNYAWVIGIVIIGVLLIMGTMGGKKDFILDLLKKQKAQFKKELDVIEKAKFMQELATKANKEKYDEAIVKIEKDLQIKVADLKASEKKDIQDMIKDYKASPSMVVKAIAERRGWEYVE